MNLDAEKTAEQIASLVNNCCYDEKPFVDAITRQHRTLQQSVFGLFLACIKRWSEMEDQCDLRNEWTVKMSKKIMEALKDDYFGRAPMI